MATHEHVPKPGEWPVDPQEDVPIDDNRIWVDGCFDFSHHGHAGAMLQARRLGSELLVGVHSDEEILDNKGPTVMNLSERCAAVEACRWATRAIPSAPYVTSLPWISHYGCRYVVHGDDITSDSNGEDCYRFVKEAGRFKVVKRTPGISTTDLVGRMLLCTRSHFIRNLENMLEGKEGPGSEDERVERGGQMRSRIAEYASAPDGKAPHVDVWSWRPKNPGRERRRSSVDHSPPVHHKSTEKGSFARMVEGKGPREGQKVIYVDGGFDLFSSGHIEFLKRVVEFEAKEAEEKGWYDPEARNRRKTESGKDYSPVYVVAGVHDDEVINHWKGVNYPIMNIFERGLCVLQCKYISALIFSAPFTPSHHFLEEFPFGTPSAVYHGPTSYMASQHDPYHDAKELGIYREINQHEYSHVNAAQIVERIMKSREMYEERQRVKGEKGIGEEAVRRREELEKKARERRWSEVERTFAV